MRSTKTGVRTRFTVTTCTMTTCTVTTALFVASFAADLAAQEKAAPQTVPMAAEPVSPALKKFDAMVQSIHKTLHAIPAYTVKVESTWATKGLTPEGKGTNLVTMTVQNPGKFRIEASPGDHPESKLTVLSDGRILSRLLAPQNVYAQAATRDPYHDLQTDSLTLHTLEGSGCEFLIRPDIHASVMSQTVRVEDLGVKETGTTRWHGFKLTLANGRDVELVMREGAYPVPMLLTTNLVIPIDEAKSFTMTIKSKLSWDLAAKPAADTFTLSLPTGAKRVNDLMDALVKGDVTQLLGKAAPAIQLKTLEGQSWELPTQPGEDIIVLYFWATWAAPSVEDIPNLQRIREVYSPKGVQFLPVDVGETPEKVRAFADKVGIRSQIYLDTNGKAIEALRTNALPAVVIIGKDRTVQAFHAGARPETKELVRKDLDTLLSGGKVVR